MTVVWSGDAMSRLLQGRGDTRPSDLLEGKIDKDSLCNNGYVHRKV